MNVNDSAEIEIRGPWDSSQVRAFLDDVTIPMRIGVSTSSGRPIVLSVWFMRDGDKIIGATRPTSTLIKCLTRNPECGFEIAADSLPYRGVRGSASVEIEQSSGTRVLDQLLLRYLGSLDTPLGKKLRSQSHDEVSFILKPSMLVSWDYSERMA
jgi:hypothetical protein